MKYQKNMKQINNKQNDKPAFEQLTTTNETKNMATATKSQTALKGGEFLIRETAAHEIFIPEEWSEEQKMIAQTCKDFVKQ